MLYVFGKTFTAVFLLASLFIPVFSVAGQRKLAKSPKAETLEIAPVEVVQVLDSPVNVSEAVLSNTDKGYVLKCSITNNLGTAINGLDYLLLVIDANNSSEAGISDTEKFKLKGYDTHTLVSKTHFALKLTQGYRLFLITHRVFDGESIWEVPKAVKALQAFASGDYSVTPRATRITNLVDTPISGKRIF